MSADFFDKNRSDISYSFYLANIIRTPSYVSSWAALQYYNLTTEAITFYHFGHAKGHQRHIRQKQELLLISQSRKSCFLIFLWLKGRRI